VASVQIFADGIARELATSSRLLCLSCFQDDAQRLKLEEDATKEKIKENQEKIKLNKQLPYLVGNVVEVGWQSISMSDIVMFSMQPSRVFLSAVV
jgi:ATP-dependent 26S proteasome regulatory subunit